MSLTTQNPSRVRALVAAVSAPPDPVMDDDPGFELKLGWIVVIAFFGVFLGWAMLARLDAAAYGQGDIAVAAHVQTVQHRDGGIVKAIHVKEGQHVNAGDVLVELAPTEVRANERSTQSQVITLLAEKARLEAERAGTTNIIPPAEFANLPADSKAEADQAMKIQQRELATRLSSVAAQKGVLRQRQAELQQQIVGLEKQVTASNDQSKSIGAELAGTKALAAKGFASINRVRALERSASGLDASTADLQANIAKARESIGEARMEALSVDTKHQEDVAKDLRDIGAQLNDISPKLGALRTQVDQTAIRAPTAGQVVGLTVFTVGGVVAPGQKVLEIVPDHSPLVVEARFKPEDAADVYVGQTVQLKFAALHDRTLPILKGTITRFSADALTDEKNNVRYYTAEVTVPPSELKTVRDIHGSNGLRPGLPVQVLAPLRKRTALQYMLEPLNQSLWRSFREH